MIVWSLFCSGALMIHLTNVFFLFFCMIVESVTSQDCSSKDRYHTGPASQIQDTKRSNFTDTQRRLVTAFQFVM